MSVTPAPRPAGIKDFAAPASPSEAASQRHPADASSGRIALFVPRLVAGGAQQVMLTLAEGFVRRGHAVDLVLVSAEGVLVPQIPPGVRVIELHARRVVYSVPALIRYLRRERPLVILSTLNTANAAAVLAARISGLPVRVAVRHAAHLSRTLNERAGPFGPLLRRVIRWSSLRADAVIAVSGGVARDLAERLRLQPARIHVVPNPIVTGELASLARRPIDHRWFTPDAAPVVLGAGRLTRQKRFDLLIRAFASARRDCEARLVILGEGEDRPKLEGLVRELGLEEEVSLPGFTDNPFAFMSRAKVFVLSSAWEGLPGVLIQALACGMSVVATDCDSGPREILQGGRFGRLVPVDDEAALAEAICAALREPGGSDPDAWRPYTESAGVDAYLRILCGPPDG